MVSNIITPEFFLGTNSPLGFFSYFNNLYNPAEGWFCYILKGGPGSGKSTIMNKVAAQSLKKGISVELIHCPSDPTSLDAVIFPKLKISIADGTYPHVLDPVYPGISDTIVNLGENWDSKSLNKYREEIIQLNNKNLLFHKRAEGYLRACKNIRNDVKNICLELIHENKALAYSKKLSKKLFKKTGKLYGKEKTRFISAITPDGIIFFEHTLSVLCNKLFIIEDRYNCVGPIILSCIKDYGINMGYDVITCYSPMSPKNDIQSILFPEIGVSFVHTNLDYAIHNLENIKYKKINCNRFMDKKLLSSHSKLLKFNRKFEKELFDEAVKNLYKAKCIHDKIEEYYIDSMDFSGTDRILKIINDKIFNHSLL